MEHFFQNIHGWFNFISIYNYVIEDGEDGDHFVEVGAWKGRSAAYMAVNIANSNKKIKFDVVDTWQGSEEHKDDDSVKNDNLYQEFLTNMEPVKDYYRPLRMTSLEAAAQYPDDSLSFVLLDASHTYKDVAADIEAWLPKVKSGGILAGDDYHHTWQGVVDAVDELLPDAEIIDNVSWAYRKP
jgi:cephalosporin hydroxylase